MQKVPTSFLPPEERAKIELIIPEDPDAMEWNSCGISVFSSPLIIWCNNVQGRLSAFGGGGGLPHSQGKGSDQIQ